MDKQILRLAVPNILSNLSVPLLSAVDTALVGHLDGLYFLGAVALGSMIFNSIYWGFGFLRMGTTGLTAQAFGNEDQREAATIFYRAMLIAGISALSLLLLASPIAALSFYLIDGSPEVEKFAASYFFIRIWAAPATLALFVIHGWFLGLQNARYPLYLSLLVNSLNIVFSVYFVNELGWHSDGVAMGTVCAQYIGLGIAIVMLYRHYRGRLTTFRISEVLQRTALGRFLSLNLDIFIRTLCLVFAFAFFTAKAAAYGDDILAAFTILLQLWHLLSYFIDGFAFASESLVGKYVGARDQKNLDLVITRSFR